MRIDSQYFTKSALLAETKLKSGRWQTLGEASDRIQSFGAYALTNQFTYTDDGIPFIRCLNIKKGFVDIDNCLRIPASANTLLHKSEIHSGMVLLTMSGSVGDAAVALPTWPYPVNSNQDVAKITPRADVNPFFLTAFLNSRYGRIQSERLPVGSVQQHIFLWMLEQLVTVRRFSEEFELAIANLIETAYSHQQTAQTSSSRAEEILRQALGLDDWHPAEPVAYSARVSEAFAVKRLDAEYFQPRYRELHRKMREHGAARLGNLVVERIRRGISPKYVDNGDIPVINSQQVGKTHIDLRDSRRTSPSLLDLAALDVRTGIVRRWDVLLNSTGRITIGRAQCLLEPVTAVADNHIAIIRPKGNIDPVYLACFLNSELGLMQTEQNYTGSSGQIELRPELVEDFLIWLAPANLQREIRETILTGHAARKHAAHLFERATHAIEIGIEMNEDAAFAIITQTDNRPHA